MADLKPCPICGSDFLRVSDFEEYVACEDCGTLGPSGRNEAEAIAAWNRRAAPPEVTALVEALKMLRGEEFWPQCAEDAITAWEAAQ